jgi:hypothetical protein
VHVGDARALQLAADGRLLVDVQHHHLRYSPGRGGGSPKQSVGIPGGAETVPATGGQSRRRVLFAGDACCYLLHALNPAVLSFDSVSRQ